jgi:hypothetical protein
MLVNVGFLMNTYILKVEFKKVLTFPQCRKKVEGRVVGSDPHEVFEMTQRNCFIGRERGGALAPHFFLSRSLCSSNQLHGMYH